MSKFNRRLVICDVETTGLSHQDVPIEIAMLMIDEHFQLIDSLQMLVKWDFFALGLEDVSVGHWVKCAEAGRIHNIPLQDVMEYGVAYDNVHLLIKQFLERNAVVGQDEPVLVSDNAKFEWFHLQKLIVVENLFHYSVWDTNLLFSCLDIKDPEPKHRAMQDVMLLYNSLRQAFNGRRLNWT